MHSWSHLFKFEQNNYVANKPTTYDWMICESHRIIVSYRLCLDGFPRGSPSCRIHVQVIHLWRAPQRDRWWCRNKRKGEKAREGCAAPGNILWRIVFPDPEGSPEVLLHSCFPFDEGIVFLFPTSLWHSHVSPLGTCKSPGTRNPGWWKAAVQQDWVWTILVVVGDWEQMHMQRGGNWRLEELLKSWVLWIFLFTTAKLRP